MHFAWDAGTVASSDDEPIDHLFQMNRPARACGDHACYRIAAITALGPLGDHCHGRAILHRIDRHQPPSTPVVSAWFCVPTASMGSTASGAICHELTLSRVGGRSDDFLQGVKSARARESGSSQIAWEGPSLSAVRNNSPSVERHLGLSFGAPLR